MSILVLLCNMQNSLHFVTDVRLSNISIITSLTDSTPSLTGPDWTVRSYQEEAYGDVGNVTFTPALTRYLSVYNSGSTGVTLREVQVYGFGESTYSDCLQ